LQNQVYNVIQSKSKPAGGGRNVELRAGAITTYSVDGRDADLASWRLA
jgi:hypothetical protein